MNNFTPLYDRILVRPEEQSSERASGLLRTEAEDKRTIFGTVVNLGKGRPMDHIDNITGDVQYYPMHVWAGDHVWFGKFSASEIILNNEKFYLVKEGELYGYESKD